MTEEITIHCYVKGKVQGVWYRASTVKEAEKLNLTGWVRNLGDGSVEVLASGPKEKVLNLVEWLKQGPPGAKVTDVSYEEISLEVHHKFTIR